MAVLWPNCLKAAFYIFFPERADLSYDSEKLEKKSQPNLLSQGIVQCKAKKLKQHNSEFKLEMSSSVSKYQFFLFVEVARSLLFDTKMFYVPRWYKLVCGPPLTVGFVTQV